MKGWEKIGVVLAVLWAFYAGYVMALSLGVMAFSWSVRDVTLYFPEGGMTGDEFMSLFNMARWSFVILTISLLLYTLVALKETK